MLRLVHLIPNNIYKLLFVLFICGFVYGSIFMIHLAFDASINDFLSVEIRSYKRNSRFSILVFLKQQIHKNSRNYAINNNNRAIATSESAIKAPTTAKTTTAIVTMMTTVIVIIVKKITKTLVSTRVVEKLSSLTMIWVTDPARNQTVIHPDLETLYLRSNLSTHDFFGQTPGTKCSWNTCGYKWDSYIQCWNEKSNIFAGFMPRWKIMETRLTKRLVEI